LKCLEQNPAPLVKCALSKVAPDFCADQELTKAKPIEVIHAH
jgi:hypothetical protein